MKLVRLQKPLGGRSMTWQTVKYSLLHMQSIHFTQLSMQFTYSHYVHGEEKKSRKSDCDTIISISN